jgi:hypothetical protein
MNDEYHSIDRRRRATNSTATQLLMRRTSVMKQTKHSIKSHRHELVHGEDADFIAYQRKFGDGLWQTVSTWMNPRTECR